MIKPSKDLQRVVDYFLFKAREDNETISNKKLQKLTYYAQAWSLVIIKDPFFNDDIEAWVHGPAIRSIYSQYKKYSYMNIPVVPQQKPLFSVDEIEVLDEVWSAYGKFDADYLEALTHSEQPWLEARGNLEASDSSTAVISLDTMQQFYTSLLKK